MKRKLLAHAVHLGSSTESSPDWPYSPIRYEDIGEEACDTIRIFWQVIEALGTQLMAMCPTVV